jgi:hypothetical protein|tara:strand:+ start:341 stop:610 length:270 start_codon:yes stop_codon:yes gene_type:complete
MKKQTQILNKIKKEMRKSFKLFPNSFFDFTDSSELAHKRVVKCLDEFNLSIKSKMDLDFKLMDWYMKLKQRILNKREKNYVKYIKGLEK